jgi:hypothetical protein
MPRRRESFPKLLLTAPWWVGFIPGLPGCAGIRWGLPVWAGHDRIFGAFASGLVPCAPLALVLFGLFALGTFISGRAVRPA